MTDEELRARQDAAIEASADRELIPYPGGASGRVAFAHDQARRILDGLEPIPEEGVLWRKRISQS